jgi:undecaprenyl diphosphate synthase
MDKEKLPRHVAIIMDGNGRWAKARNLPRTQGHLEGVKRVEEVIRSARALNIECLTIYAFSTENWTRPPDEVSMLMRTFIAVLGHKARDLKSNGVRICFIGRRQGVPAEVLKAIDEAMALTASCTNMILNVAFNYGGRAEIMDAVKAIARGVEKHEITVDDIDDQLFSSHLYTKACPDPDLLIRTSGEKRISNFLLWQLSYAEFYFTEKFWPDFNEVEFHNALNDFAKRERRWGGVKIA